jgi:hypothetical protein
MHKKAVDQALNEQFEPSLEAVATLLQHEISLDSLY